jgi:sulfite reductase alpha subunit-like flavoprotein
MKPLTLGALVVSSKRRFSLDINLQGENITAVAPTVKEIEPTLEEIALDKSSSNNPILKALAERLDLQVIGVKKILDEGKSYFKNEAIKEIAQRIATSEKKAEDIFQKMLNLGTLQRIGSTDAYYISSSTPF